MQSQVRKAIVHSSEATVAAFEVTKSSMCNMKLQSTSRIMTIEAGEPPPLR